MSKWPWKRKGKQGWFNIKKSIYAIHHLTKFYMHDKKYM